jgi:flagellar protein FlaG
VVKVINRQTDEIIRQIPPEELLEIHANMKKMSGLLFYQNV